MDILEGALNAAIAEQVRPERIFAMLISGKLRERGLVASDGDLKKLEAAYFSVLSGNDIKSLDLECATEGASIVISDKDVDALLRVYPRAIETAVGDAIEHLVTSASEKLSSAQGIAFAVRHGQAEFVSELRVIWGEALDSLLALAQLSAELCDSSNTAGRKKLRNKAFVDVVTRLHARGCLIAREIVLLLENGLSQAAHARWRALHEVTVIAMFIAKHKNPAAVRFLASAVVEQKRHTDSYERHMAKLGEQPIPKSVRKKIDRDFERAALKYGKSFADGDYGWASYFLKKGRANFSDLEAAADLEHYRPWYKVASMYIHGSARGLKAPMGLSEDILLTGPHHEIVPEIALHTINSLMVLNSIGIDVAVNVDRLVTARILMGRGDEARQAFSKAVALYENVDQPVPDDW